MKVSYISTWQTECGIANYTSNLINALAENGVESSVQAIDRPMLRTLSRDELIAHFVKLADSAADADVVHLQHEYGLLFGSGHASHANRVLRAMVQELDDRGVPMLITWHSEPFERGRFPRRPWNVPGWLMADRHWQRAVAAINSSSSTLTIAHTDRTRDAHVAAGFASDRVVTIPHATPPYRPAPSGEERAARLAAAGLPADAFVLTIFGFVSLYKGYATALAALDKLPPNFHLVIAGGAHPESPEWERRAIESIFAQWPQLSDRVHMTGYLPAAEVAGQLELTDVCLAPYVGAVSLSSSGAVTSMIASGKPVIASNIFAFREAAERGAPLVFVPPDDPVALAEAITRVAGDQDLRGRLNESARQFCEEFGWPRVALRHLAKYEALAGAQKD